MEELTSFRSVIGLWPSVDAMSVDVGAKASAIRKWSQRDRIPAEWWRPILETPVARERGLTAEVMTELAAREMAGAHP